MFLFAVDFQKSKAAKVFYVLPDDSFNASCSFQPCHTLDKYLLINNGKLPIKTNVEYRFLPGEHHVPVNMVLTNLNNFSIIGDVSKPLSQALWLVVITFMFLKLLHPTMLV